MKIDLEHFPTSPSARQMISRISPIYEKSYVGKWIFQVMGVEFDDARLRFDELRQQAFPETATWSIEYWEQRYGISPNPADSLETRRQVVLARQEARQSMNPAKMEDRVKAITGCHARVEENVDDYTFAVVLELESSLDAAKLTKALKYIRLVKPSHQCFLIIFHETVEHRLYAGFAVRVGRVIAVGCEIPAELDVTYLTDEAGNLLADEAGNRIIDEED